MPPQSPYFTLIIITLLLGLSTSATKKQIFLQESKTISIEVDQVKEQMIPQFFDIYQSTSLKNFTRVGSNANSEDKSQHALKVCKIQDVKESSYVVNSVFYHYKLADPERYFLGRKKVYNFADLSKLTGIIDVVQFNNQVITLFQNGFYSFYSIDPKNGQVSLKEVKLLYDQQQNIHEANYGVQVYKTAINYGNLIKYTSSNSSSSTNHGEEYLLFFGEDQVLLMNSTKNIFDDVIGYEPIGIQFEKAILVGEKLYVAAGDLGVFVYQMDFKKKAIKLLQKFSPYVTYANVEVHLQVVDILYDPINTKFIVVDEDQGIHWVSIPQPTQRDGDTSQIIKTQSIASQHSINIEGCSNLQFISEQESVIATCPQLLVINLTTKSHQLIDEIEFSPQSVLVNESRVLIFGEYRYAVYDLETDLVEKGESTQKIDFVSLIKGYIVVVNTFGLSTGVIHPTLQQISCFVDSQASASLLGQSTANLTIEGICSQLFPTPLSSDNTSSPSLFYPSTSDISTITTHSKEKENCQLIYSVKFQIVNSSQVSYWWEIIAGAVIAWILCSSMIVYCVKDIKVRKQYEQLQEETNSARDKNSEQSDNQLFEKK